MEGLKGLNRAYLIGRIGHEPKVETGLSGKPVLKLSLATPRSVKVNDTFVETDDWHRLTVLDENVEFLAKHAHKGDVLAVECSIRPGKWTDKDGHKHEDVSLIVDRILMLSGRSGATDS